MTPAERVVIAAAERWAERVRPDTGLGVELTEAVAALRAEREPKTKEQRAELDITYGQVAEGDHVLSPKLGRWYEVTAVVAQPNGKVRITMPRTGRPAAGGKPQINAWHDFNSTTPCRVRRGETGQAVDMFATVLWSAPTKTTEARDPEPGLGLELDVAQDPEAAVAEPENDDEEGQDDE
jgi:hypothetical protein